METDIIPKKPSQHSVWINVLFYISLVSFILVLIIFFVLNSSVNNTQKTLKNLEEDLAKENTADKIALKKEITDYQKKINAFSKLLDQHLSNAEVFKVVEEKTHPKAYFTQASIDSRTGIVLLSGQTQSFESLGQQLLLFRGENLVKSAALGQIVMSKDGRIEFTLSLTIDPEVFKPVIAK